MPSKVSDSGRAKTDALVKALKGARVTVGVHEDVGSQKKATVEGEPDTDLTLAEVMTKHELGLGVPRRSFIGDWFDGKKPELETTIQKIAANAAKTGMPIEQALARFGVWAVGEIQQRIADGIEPELSARRLKEKEDLTGSPKETPLIFTGQFRSSIASKVEPNG